MKRPKSKRRLLTSQKEEVQYEEPYNKDDPTYIQLFLHYVDYDPAKINWFKVKEFDEGYGMNLTLDQKNFLHNLQFKISIKEYL